MARQIERPDPSHYPSEELEVLANSSRYQQWIVAAFAPYLQGRVMEIGAGIGTMSRYWTQYVAELHVVEPASNLLPKLRRNLEGKPNVVLHGNIVEHIVATQASLCGGFDAVIMVNVLEHIADDVGMLQTIAKLLTPKGYLLIFVPALPRLFGSLDRIFGHQRRYTRSSLSAVARQAGYTELKLSYFDILGVLPWWFVNRVVKSTTINPVMSQLYDRLAVPVGRMIEKHLPPPVGKNLVLVCRKPSSIA